MSYAKITESLKGMNEGWNPEARSDPLEFLVIFALEIVKPRTLFGKKYSIRLYFM